jgi:TolB-like protein
MFNKPITPLFRYGLIACLLIVGNVARAADINREFETIANSLAAKIAATNKTKIAVADLTDLQGVVHQLGRFVSEEIAINLVLSGRKFTVIDRNHLRTILREQKLSMSGLMDPRNQKKLGKILGVDALLLGSITSFGESYRITFKMVATDTAQVVAADRGSIPKTPATNELWDTIIEDDSVVGVSGGAVAIGSPRIVRGGKKGAFRNQFLELAFESVAQRKDKKSLTLVVRLTNLTKHDIYVAESSHSTITDDVGVTWERRDLSGLISYSYDSDNFHKYAGTDYYSSPEKYLSLMTAGQSQPVNYTFQPKGGAGDAKLLSFSTTLYLKVPAKDGKDDKWRYITVGIGISGIKLR